MQVIKMPENIKSVQLVFMKKKPDGSFGYYQISMKENSETDRELKKWLYSTAQIINGSEKIPYDPTTDCDGLFSFDPSELDGWIGFRDEAFTLSNCTTVSEFDELNKIDFGYYIYCLDGNEVYAQFNKITRSYYLDKGFYFLTSSFDKIIEEKGIKLCDSPDVFIHANLEEAVQTMYIFNKKNFETLFSLHEYQKVKASDFIRKTLSLFEGMEEIKEELLEDKNIVRILNKPAIVRGEYNENIDYIKSVKGKMKNLPFEIKNEKILFPENLKDKKKAFKELIKVITYHYNQTFDSQLIEGNPIQIIK